MSATLTAETGKSNSSYDKAHGAGSVAFDLVDTIISVAPFKSRIVSQEMGIAVSPENCNSTYVGSLFNKNPRKKQKALEKYRSITEHFLLRSDFIENAPPINGAFENIQRYWDLGRLVYGISKESPKVEPVFNDYFQHYFHAMPLLEIGLTDHMSKRRQCIEYKVALLHDNSRNNLLTAGVVFPVHFDLYDQNPGGKGLVGKRSWYESHGCLVADQMGKLLNVYESTVQNKKIA